MIPKKKTTFTRGLMPDRQETYRCISFMLRIDGATEKDEHAAPGQTADALKKVFLWDMLKHIHLGVPRYRSTY